MLKNKYNIWLTGQLKTLEACLRKEAINSMNNKSTHICVVHRLLTLYFDTSQTKKHGHFSLTSVSMFEMDTPRHLLAQ